MSNEREKLEYERSSSPHAENLQESLPAGDRSASGRPTFESLDNKWRHEESLQGRGFRKDDGRKSGCCDLGGESSCLNAMQDLVRSRRFRRTALLTAFIVSALYWMCNTYLTSRMEQGWTYEEGYLQQRLNGTYGSAQAGSFDGIRIKDLDPVFVPGGHHDHEGKRRLVFVGDIHGCRDELMALLVKVSFNEDADHLVTVGDVVSKGPHNLEVLDELIRLRADSIRGNHEDLLLEAAKTVLNSELHPQSAASMSKGATKDAALLKQLKQHHLKFIGDMPLMLRIPALAHRHHHSDKHDKQITQEIIVVHAGLVPAVPLNEQDPYYAMNMRTIHRKTHLPSTTRASKDGTDKPWHEVWNWYNDRLAHGRSLKEFVASDYHVIENGSWSGKLWNTVSGIRRLRPEPQVVIYGHDSKAGLQLHPWSKGLDSACVSGGRLTALILDARGDTEVVSVGCKDYKA